MYTVGLFVVLEVSSASVALQL